MTDMADQDHTGGMIALVPAVADADRLAVSGGDDPADLHLTLAYLGDDVTGWTDDQRASVLAGARREAARVGPILARVMGHAVFNPDGHAEREPCAVHLVGDSHQIAPLREELGEYSDEVQHEPWLPHVTAGYGLDAGALSYTGPIVFDRLRVALADDVTDIPLTGPGLDEPGEPDGDDVEQKQQATAWLRNRRGAGVGGIEVKADSDRDGIPDDKDPSPKGSTPPAKTAADSGGKVRKVASKAGEKRYGKPIGTPLGQARDEKAKQAQDAPGAREAYDKLMGANPREYQKMLDDMDDAELEALSRAAYSFRSSDPRVVQARIAIAGALSRRGRDVDDFGGLGKGSGKTGGAGSKPGGAKPGTAKTSRAAPKGSDPTWVGEEDWKARRTRRTKLGLMGAPGSIPPDPPNKRGEGGAMMTLHVYEDGSWQYKAAAGAEVESKRDHGAGPDEWDPDLDLAAYIESKVMSPDPKAAKLREYWAHGKGRSKWRPGTPGDFERLRKHLRKYVPPKMLNGLTANIHKLATGKWPGPGGGSNRHKSGEPAGLEWTALDPQMLVKAAEIGEDADGVLDDDAVSLALDRYAAMTDELTTEEEYEQALAEEIEWDLLPDGTLEREDGLDSTTDLNPDEQDEEHEPGDRDPDEAIADLEEMFAH